MKVTIDLDDNKINELIKEQVESKVKQLTWVMREAYVDKLVEKITPEELKVYKTESRDLFEEKLRDMVRDELNAYQFASASGIKAMIIKMAHEIQKEYDNDKVRSR
jgi:uroporphyrinogen-III synthase